MRKYVADLITKNYSSTMFLQNKYNNWYNNIIYSAKGRVNYIGYTEKHHIIPKSLGGSNNKLNIVRLTAREHFVCHLLLTKMLTGNAKHKMSFALNRMISYNIKHQRYIPSSKIYEIVRKFRSDAISAAHKGIPETKESNIKRSVALKGINKTPLSASTKEKISKANKGRPSLNKGGTTILKGLSYEQIHGIEKAAHLKQIRSNSMKGRKFSAETKKLWSKSRKGKTCGGGNSNAVPITINNKQYDCKKDAQAELGISLYQLNKILKSVP